MLPYEKQITLKTGRIVRLVLDGIPEDPQEVILHADVSICDPGESGFHVPIGETHPKYWKLKTLDGERARILQARYSGLGPRDLRRIVRDLNKTLLSN